MRSSSGHASSSKSSRIRIAVRVRPLSAEEESKGHACIVERVNDTGVRVWDPSCLDLKSSSDRGLVAAWSRDFFYDHCLWSVSSLDSNFANQQVGGCPIALSHVDTYSHPAHCTSTVYFRGCRETSGGLRIGWIQYLRVGLWTDR